MQLNKDMDFVRVVKFSAQLNFSTSFTPQLPHVWPFYISISKYFWQLESLESFRFFFFFNPKASNLLLHLISSFWQLWVSSCNPARWHLYKVLIEQCLFKSCLRGMAQTFSLHCSLTSLVSRQHLKSNKPLKNTWTHQNIVRSAWRRILGSS